jgi:hypothetical protein
MAKKRRNKLNMKMSMLLCGVALLAAGCSSPQNPFASSGEFSYTYDLVPQPVPDIPPSELSKIEQVPVIGSYTSSSGSGSWASSGR